MSNWGYVFDLSMLFLFWIGVISIIVAILLRIRRNRHKLRSETGELSITKAQKIAD